MATYKELVSDTKFEAKFKRLVWLYYNYGFYGTDALKDRTSQEDWDRLEKAFSGYMVWKKDNEKKRLTVIADAQELDHNCVQDLYRRCEPKNIINLFNVCGYFAKNTTWNKQYVMNRLQKYHDNYEMYLESAEIERLIAEIKGCETPEAALAVIDGADTNATIKKVLKGKIELGRANEYTSDDLVACINGRREGNADPDDKNTVRNQLKLMIQTGFLSDRQDKNAGGKHNYTFSYANIGSLLEYGKKADAGFEEHLTDALAFFSRSFPFGEIGTFIRERYQADYRNPFRVKDDYLMQSVNDYHILDLLDAIKNQQWVRLRYKHGTKPGIDTTLFVYPIRIRTSVTNGRQFLMIYDPFQRSVSSARIEFIRDIEVMDDSHAKKLLSETAGLNGDDIRHDIENGIRLINASWGVSTSFSSPQNAYHSPAAQHVRMVLRTGENGVFKSQELTERLYKGKRTAQIAKTGRKHIAVDAEVSDAMEMVPYFRTFYGCIDKLEHPDLKWYEIRNDLNRMITMMERSDLPEEREYFNPYKVPKTMWKIPKEAADIMDTEYKHCFSRQKTHVKLFNEYFSFYNLIYADLVMRLSSVRENRISGMELNKKINEALEKISRITDAGSGDSLPQAIRARRAYFEENAIDVLVKKGLLCPLNQKSAINSIRQEFRINIELPGNKDLYKDLIPLSDIECEWLNTILEDAKIDLFLTKEEKECIREWLAEKHGKTGRIPVELIECFDRYVSGSDEWNTTSSAMRKIMEGIRNSRVCEITCRNRANTKKVIPLNVVYTKRNDSLELIAADQTSPGGYLRIPFADLCVEKVTEETFDYDDQLKEYLKYRKACEKKIVIEFYERKSGNIADRVLTELSQFKKECVYDISENKYVLTVWYQSEQQDDVTLRLQSFGNFIRIVDHNHEIYKTILERVRTQQNLLKEKEPVLQPEHSER